MNGHGIRQFPSFIFIPTLKTFLEHFYLQIPSVKSSLSILCNTSVTSVYPPCFLVWKWCFPDMSVSACLITILLQFIQLVLNRFTDLVKCTNQILFGMRMAHLFCSKLHLQATKLSFNLHLSEPLKIFIFIRLIDYLMRIFLILQV